MPASAIAPAAVTIQVSPTCWGSAGVTKPKSATLAVRAASSRMF